MAGCVYKAIDAVQNIEKTKLEIYRDIRSKELETQTDVRKTELETQADSETKKLDTQTDLRKAELSAHTDQLAQVLQNPFSPVITPLFSTCGLNNLAPRSPAEPGIRREEFFPPAWRARLQD